VIDLPETKKKKRRRRRGWWVEKWPGEKRIYRKEKESVDGGGVDLFLVINVVIMHEVGPSEGPAEFFRWDIYENSETHSGAHW
jgi:hypothetical protein